MAIEGLPVDEALQPLLTAIQPFLSKLSLLLGGVFGVYVLYILVKMYYERKKVALLKDIRYNSEQLNTHFGVAHSGEKKGIFRKLFTHFKKKEKVDEKKKNKK